MIETETMVAVSPEDFAAGLECGAGDGKLAAYVVTLSDVTAQAEADAAATAQAVVLPSSAPVSCGQTIGFGDVTVNHSYVARVDGYQQDNLRPLVPGSRTMVDRKSGQWVSPAWSTTCGQARGTGLSNPATASDQETVWLHGCTPFDSAARPLLNLVRVAPASFLGELTCGQDAGQIASYTVSVEGSSQQTTVPCASAALLGGLAAGDRLTLTVRASSADGAQLWQTSCDVLVAPETTTDAVCSKLEP